MTEDHSKPAAGRYTIRSNSAWGHQVVDPDGRPVGQPSRLAGVVIECLDFGEFIRRYDTPGTLFYLDPPYWGSEGDYGQTLFSRTDFQRMADQMAGIKGGFILSINDVPEIREMFGWAEIEDVSTTYTVARAGKARGQRAELLIQGGAL